MLCKSSFHFRQAHFDCVPPHFTVIDGARSKWCHLLLVNAIIGILDFESFNLAARRKFNQQQILCECIKEELEYNGVRDVINNCEAVEGVFGADWADMKSLRKFLEQNSPYKSKEKYLGILDILLSHKAILATGTDITKSINFAMRKILAPGNRKSGRRQPVPVVKSKRVLSQQLVLPNPPPPPPPTPTTSAAALGRKRARAQSVKYEDKESDDEVPVVKKVKRKPHVRRVPVKLELPHKTYILPKNSSNPPGHRLPKSTALTVYHKSDQGHFHRSQHEEVDEEEQGSEDEYEVDGHRGRTFSFDGEAVFIDHEDGEEIDPNAQPWELLDPMPSRDTSPTNFRRLVGPPDCAHGACFQSGSALSLRTPEACKLLVPFPEYAPTALLHLSPFPLEDLPGNPFYHQRASNAMF